MRSLLRELESNQLALLMVTLGFLLVLLIIGMVAAKLFGVDLNFFLGIAGMGTGTHVATATNQASQARSPNYTPMIANPSVAPLPSPASGGGSSPPPPPPGPQT